MSTYPNSDSIQASQKVLDLLRRLHRLSSDQEALIKDPNGEYALLRDSYKDDDEETQLRKRDTSMQDKFVALEADKATLTYNLVRATGALNVVEAGTSFGVSTIYLALAVGQNAKLAGKGPGEAKVIATEHWPEKARQARKYWSEAGEDVEPWIELREGDITKTLETDMPTIDFVLFDIWTPMVVPTLDVIKPHLRPGAVLLCDNTASFKDAYAAFFHRLKGPGSKYKTMTLPFEGGFEMATYWP